MTSSSLNFFQDVTTHPCSYIDGELARNIYPDPEQAMTPHLYGQLIQHGFRRSGNQAYRPYCPACQSCISVRIDVERFTASRSQRRCLKRNAHLSINLSSASFSPHYFELYCDYLNHRHKEGGMDNPTEESYCNFLLSDWCETLFIELKDQNKLVAVAVTDQIDNALSAFYTFFEPTLEQHSLGTFAILKQIELAQQQDQRFLYLGYWVESCQKMSYKKQFSGLEGYIDQHWQPLK